MTTSARPPVPPSPPADQDRRGLGSLFKDLAEDGAHLVRQEIRLARTEIATAARAVGVGTVFVTLGALMLLLGVLAVITGVALLAGDQWLRDRYWLGALVVAVVAAIAGALAAARGRRRLEPEQLVPDETTESLKENTVWLKRQLTSDGTSR